MNRLALFLFVLLLLPADVIAQNGNCTDRLSGDRFVGCVNNLLEKRWLFFSKTVSSSRSAEIRRPGEGARVDVLRPVSASDPILGQDRILLGSNVDMELLISHGGNRSRVILERGGLWQVRRDSVPQLVISHGQMVVDQLQGRLEAYLEDVLNVIHATTVYYDVDSTSGTSRVFLSEGHISFPEWDIDVQGRYMLWVVRRGMAPEPVAATPEMIERWRHAEEQARTEIWRRASTPIVSRPKFWLLAGGLAAGMVLLDCAVTHVACGGEEEYRIPRN